MIHYVCDSKWLKLSWKVGKTWRRGFIYNGHDYTFYTKRLDGQASPCLCYLPDKRQSRRKQRRQGRVTPVQYLSSDEYIMRYFGSSFEDFLAGLEAKENWLEWLQTQTNTNQGVES